jgi:hypothetical protein
MKQIIEGKVYNTETAELIGSAHNGYSTSDFRRKTEKLYHTMKGSFFLHGIGGAMTEYGEDCGDSRSGGHKLIPMTEQAAFVWAQEHLSTDIVEDIFGHLVQEA